MNILVTGASGFIGTNLCPYLAGMGHTVIGIDRRSPPEPPRQWDFHPVDLLDVTQISRLFLGLDEPFDCCVHLAGKGGVRGSILDPVTYVDANVRTTASLLGYCGQRTRTRFILASSSSVYGNAAAELTDDREGCPEGFARNPMSPYAATKCAAEDLVRSWWLNHRGYGFSAIALRFFACYGPWNRQDMAIWQWAKRIRDGQDLQLFGKGMKRDWTPVSDICAGIKAACEHEHGGYEVLNLGSGNPIDVDRMMIYLHREMTVANSAPNIVDAGEQPGDVRMTHADISKTYDVLGWVPKTGHEKGIREFVAWYDAVAGSIQ